MEASFASSLHLNCVCVCVLTWGVFFSPDIQSSKHKDRRKGSLDVRSTTSRGSDGESEGRQMTENSGRLSVCIKCWLDTRTHSLGSVWKTCSLICLLNYVIQRCFFCCFLHPDREFTAKTLLNGQNPLHDYRSPHHQGGFISLLPRASVTWFALRISWLNSWVMELPQSPRAVLVQLHAPRLKATHTMSSGDVAISCRISYTSTSDQNDLLFGRFLCSAVCVVGYRESARGRVIWHTAETTAVSLDCAVSPCRHRPLQNKALIELLPCVCVCVCVCVCSCTCWLTSP